LATIRFGWLVALGRITVVAFLALFLLFLSRPSIRKSAGHNEALAMALEIGIVISFAGVLAVRWPARPQPFACMRRTVVDARHRHVMLVEPAGGAAGRGWCGLRRAFPSADLVRRRCAGFLDGVVGRRHAAIDRLLQMISLMSSGEKPPSANAARTCRRNSSHCPSATMVPMTSTRLVRWSKCGRSRCRPRHSA